MRGRLDTLYRHPVKGFTPERLALAELEAQACFPCDRLYAVENGPCGFDPARPAQIGKMKLTVLAAIPALARVRTAYDDARGVLTVQAPGGEAFAADLTRPAGRQAFADWLTGFIDPRDRRGPLRVIQAAGPQRFMDDPAGAVSLINLESVRDLGRRLGRPVDPARFRGNLYVDGLPAWAEMELDAGAEIAVGEAVLRMVKPIVRCVATHVDPATGERDIDLVPALHQHYGHLHCGLYLSVAWGGRVAQGDPVELPLRRAMAGQRPEPPRPTLSS